MNERPQKPRPNLSAKGQTKAELRRKRLGAALRRNLKRRKLQQGSRHAAEEPVDTPGGDTGEGS